MSFKLLLGLENERFEVYNGFGTNMVTDQDLRSEIGEGIVARP